MTVHVLITGTLLREPQQKTSQAGKRYVAATVKAAAADDGAADFWNIVVFSETSQAELLRLGLNERLAIQGALKLELYEKDGRTRLSRTVFVDHVMPLRAAARDKKPKAETPRTPSTENFNVVPPARPAPFDDDIPF